MPKRFRRRSSGTVSTGPSASGTPTCTASSTAWTTRNGIRRPTATLPRTTRLQISRASATAARICCMPSVSMYPSRRLSSAFAPGSRRRRDSTCLEQIASRLAERDVAVVALGTGEPYYEKFFRDFAYSNSGRFAVQIRYDEALAHKVEAGADIFLMPSRFEPCGLNQIYSLKYGTVPVVRATGGLDDTVEEWNPDLNTGTGFKFGRYDAEGAARCDRSRSCSLQRQEAMDSTNAERYGAKLQLGQTRAGVRRGLRRSGAEESLKW